MKAFIRSLVPPILLEIFRNFKPSKYGWHGKFRTWEEAKKYSTGYDSEAIIEKVRESALKVKKGEAVYERDSVIFDKIEYSWPLLAGLMYAAAKSGGVLKVCDFGGSLGSTYFQNKKFLDGLTNVIWCIVEQKSFVDVGKSDFEDERLKFYYDVETCIKEQNPNVLILSGVLQYIEKPYEMLNNILNHSFEFILIDRTPFGRTKQIKVQIVSPDIYNASYPCWFFDENEFLCFFMKRNYKIIESFNALDGKKKNCEFKGYIIEKLV